MDMEEEKQEDAEMETEKEVGAEARGEAVGNDKLAMRQRTVAQCEMFEDKVPCRVPERFVPSRDRVTA